MVAGSIIPPRKWVTKAFFFGLLLLLILIAATYLAQTRALRDYARIQAEAAVRRELGLKLHIQDVDLEPQGLTIVARGITLDHPEYGRLAEARLLRIRPSIFALLKGKIDLHSIDIEFASLRLLVRNDHIVNFPNLPKVSSNGDQIKLPFERLNIIQSQLYVDAGHYGSGKISRIDIEVEASHAGLIRIATNTAHGYIDHDLGRELIQRIQVIGQVTSDNIQLELLHVETHEMHLVLRHAGLSFPLGQRYHGDIELDLDLSQIEKWPHDLSLPTLEGKLQLRASVADDTDGPTAGGRLRITRGKIKNRYSLGKEVELTFDGSKDRIDWKGTIQLFHEGGNLDLSGILKPTKNFDLDLDVEVKEVSFAVLMKQLGVSPNAIVDWNLIGSFHLHGTLNPLDLSGNLHFPTRDFQVTRDAWHSPKARRILAIDTARLDGKVGVRPDGIHLEQMRVKLPQSQLTADVLLGFDDRLWVRGGSEQFDLTDCTPLLEFELSGQGGFGVEIDGTFSQPTVRGNLRFDDFAFSTYPFGDLRSDFQLEKNSQAVRFPIVTASKGESQYVVHDLLLDFSDRRFLASADLDIHQLTLADFYHVFHYENDERYEDYQGLVKGNSRIRYTMDYPGDSPAGTMIADIDLDIPECQLNELSYENGRFQGNWKWIDHRKGYRGGVLTIEHGSLHKGNGTVNISGKMNLQGQLDIVLMADRIGLRETEGISTYLPDFNGNYGLVGTIKGTVAAPRADIDLNLTSLSYKGKPLGDGRFYVRLTNKEDPWVNGARRWSKKEPPPAKPCAYARQGFANGRWPEDPPLRTSEGLVPALDQPMAYLICGQALGGQLRLDMAVGRTQTFPLRGMLRLKDFQIKNFIPQASRTEPLHGSLSGNILFTDGAILDPYNLSGHINLSKVAFRRRDVKLHNDGALDVRVNRGSFRIGNAKFSAASSNLRIAGSGSLYNDLDLRVDGDIHLGLLSNLLKTESQTEGQVGLRFNIKGGFENPAVNGTLEIKNAKLLFTSFPEPIESLNGRITFNTHRVLLDGFQARMAGGRLGLRGTAELHGRGLGGYNLEIEADNIELIRTEDEGFESKFDGYGQLSWEKGQLLPVLSGVLRLESFLYSRPIEVSPMLSDVYRPKKVIVERYNPDLDRIALDLKVVHSKPLKIENNLLDAELEIQNSAQPFRIVGTDQRFGVVGNVTFKKGILRFRDTEFDIRQGEIGFTEKNRISPQFDIEAVTNLRRSHELSSTDYFITIRAKGNRESFKLKTSSDPYLPEEDIALLLAIGMTRSEIQTGDLTETAALEALASVTGVNREVRRAVPAIDDFSIKSSYSEYSHRTEPQVSIGKRIADRVRLNASTGLSQTRDFSTGVELQINDQTSVEAVYNNQNANTVSSQIGDLGVDLNWRLEFD